MDAHSAKVREIAVPASVFITLRRELEKEAGKLPAIHALHAAGYRSGGDAATELVQRQRAGAHDAPAPEFWRRLDAFFRQRGWGSVRHTHPHPGVGLLTSRDWAEADPDDPSAEASCTFTTGFLSGLLTALAEGPLAVLEVSCRGRGEEACRFAFGSAPAIHELYGRLLEDPDLERALARL